MTKLSLKYLYLGVFMVNLTKTLMLEATMDSKRANPIDHVWHVYVYVGLSEVTVGPWMCFKFLPSKRTAQKPTIAPAGRSQVV